jgi:hypothetical protein
MPDVTGIYHQSTSFVPNTTKAMTMDLSISVPDVENSNMQDMTVVGIVIMDDLLFR